MLVQLLGAAHQPKDGPWVLPDFVDVPTARHYAQKVLEHAHDIETWAARAGEAVSLANAPVAEQCRQMIRGLLARVQTLESRVRALEVIETTPPTKQRRLKK
jgi:hypothetical protein